MPRRCPALAALAGRAVAGASDRLEFIVFHSAGAFAPDRPNGPNKQHAASRLSRWMLEMSGSPTHSGRLLSREGAGAGAGAVGATDSARVEREHDKQFLFTYCQRLLLKETNIEQVSANPCVCMYICVCICVVPHSPSPPAVHTLCTLRYHLIPPYTAHTRCHTRSHTHAVTHTLTHAHTYTRLYTRSHTRSLTHFLLHILIYIPTQMINLVLLEPSY